MIATAHSLVGGAVAASVSDPILGITISTISHPLLDMVPHWDFGRNWKKQDRFTFIAKSLGDLFIGYILAYLIFYNANIPMWYFWACVLLSSGWDPATGPYMLFNWKFPPFSWLYHFQNKIQNDTDMKTGLLIQGIFILGLIYVVNFIH